MLRAMWLSMALVALSTATVSLAQNQAGQPEQKPKMICKRSADTGSLIAKRRECRTREEWDRIAEASRMAGQYEIDRQMTRGGGM